MRALSATRGVNPAHFFQTSARRTFTYCKPLIMEPGQPPRELNRLDSKNWTPTPLEVSQRIADSLAKLRSVVDAVILMDQVDVEETGVVTKAVLARVDELEKKCAPIPVLADSRRGLLSLIHIYSMGVGTKYKMMGFALITWSSGSEGLPAPKEDRDVLRCAVNDVIMALDDRNRSTVGYALTGLVELGLSVKAGDDRSSLMLRWQETPLFKKLMSASPVSVGQKSG